MKDIRDEISNKEEDDILLQKSELEVFEFERSSVVEEDPELPNQKSEDTDDDGEEENEEESTVYEALKDNKSSNTGLTRPSTAFLPTNRSRPVTSRQNKIEVSLN